VLFKDAIRYTGGGRMDLEPLSNDIGRQGKTEGEKCVEVPFCPSGVFEVSLFTPPPHFEVIAPQEC
jgi:hypothetical protein